MFDTTFTVFPIQSGVITEEALVKILKNKRGEPLSEEEVQSMYKGNPPISGGKNY